MKYQKQGKDECILATISMLSGQEIESVRARARALTGHTSWHDWMVEVSAMQPQVATLCFDRVCQTLCKEGGIPHVGKGVAGGLIMAGLPEYDLSGKGEIVIAGVWKGKSFAHSMAYEEWLVFDPDRGTEDGEPLDEVLDRMVPGTRVVRVTPVSLK